MHCGMFSCILHLFPPEDRASPVVTLPDVPDGPGVGCSRCRVGALRPQEDFGEVSACGCNHPRAASGPVTGGQDHLPAHISPVRPPGLFAEKKTKSAPSSLLVQTAAVARGESWSRGPERMESTVHVQAALWWAFTRDLGGLADTYEPTCGFQPGGEHTGQVSPGLGPASQSRAVPLRPCPRGCQNSESAQEPLQPGLPVKDITACQFTAASVKHRLWACPAPEATPPLGAPRGNPQGCCCHRHRGFWGRRGVEGLERLPNSCWGQGGGHEARLPQEPAGCSQRVPRGRTLRGGRI